MSNLDILEQKIGQAIERLQKAKRENDQLRSQLSELESERQQLRGRVQELEHQLQGANSEGQDLELIRGRLDGILSKFEVLDL